MISFLWLMKNLFKYRILDSSKFSLTWFVRTSLIKCGAGIWTLYLCHHLELQLFSEDAIIYGFLPCSFMAPRKHD